MLVILLEPFVSVEQTCGEQISILKNTTSVKPTHVFYCIVFVFPPGSSQLQLRKHSLPSSSSPSSCCPLVCLLLYQRKKGTEHPLCTDLKTPDNVCVVS